MTGYVIVVVSGDTPWRAPKVEARLLRDEVPPQVAKRWVRQRRAITVGLMRRLQEARN